MGSRRKVESELFGMQKNAKIDWRKESNAASTKVAVVEKGRREEEGEWKKKDEVELIWEAARRSTELRQNQIHRDDYNSI